MMTAMAMTAIMITTINRHLYENHNKISAMMTAMMMTAT